MQEKVLIDPSDKIGEVVQSINRSIDKSIRGKFLIKRSDLYELSKITFRDLTTYDKFDLKFVEENMVNVTDAKNFFDKHITKRMGVDYRLRDRFINYISGNEFLEDVKKEIKEKIDEIKKRAKMKDLLDKEMKKYLMKESNRETVYDRLYKNNNDKNKEEEKMIYKNKDTLHRIYRNKDMLRKIQEQSKKSKESREEKRILPRNLNAFRIRIL